MNNLNFKGYLQKALLFIYDVYVIGGIIGKKKN